MEGRTLKRNRNRIHISPGPVAAIGVLLMSSFAIGQVGSAHAEYVGATARPVVDESLPSYVLVTGLSGRLTVAGSDTMQPMLARLASEFSRRYPDVKIAVEGGGSHTAWQEFLDSHAQARRGDGNTSGHLGSYAVMLMASSRALSAEEIKTFVSRYGYEPTAIPIALDAIAIYVHKDSPLPGLTLEQLDALFSTTRKRGLPEIVTWGQLGLNNGWETVPVRLHGRDKQSGTREFFKEHVLQGGEFKETVKEEPGSASVVLAVARDPSAIGYSGIGYQTSWVRVLPLAEKTGMPFVVPSSESAANGTYPLSRPLYLYVKKAPKAELNPVLLEFLKFANSREGQATVVKAGAYPLPPAQVAKNLQTLTDSAVVATRR